MRVMWIYLHESHDKSEGRKLVYYCYHGNTNDISDTNKKELSTLRLLRFPVNHPRIAYVSTKRLMISYISLSINDLPPINQYIHLETSTTPHRDITFFNSGSINIQTF